MAGGKRKKKPSNPARQVATTSIVSKRKEEEQQDAASTDASRPGTPSTIPTSVASEDVKPDEPAVGTSSVLRETPEELEARLELHELQQLVDKYAVRARREAARTANRLQTERRLLRSQANSLTVKEWLPEELMLLLNTTISGSPGYHVNEIKPRHARSLGDDDMLAKVWQLRLCLFDLQLPSDRIQELLGYLVSNPPLEGSSGIIWGLSEALNWLALRCSEDELPPYDEQKAKQILYSADGSRPESPLPQPNPGISDVSHTNQNGIQEEKKNSTFPGLGFQGISTNVNDSDVSDVESDIDPRELLSVYLRTRARLFEMNPDSNKNSSEFSTPQCGLSNQQSSALSGAERKLQQKLKSIESDVLFDQRDGHAQWAQHRIVMVREAAERKRLQLGAGGTHLSTSPVSEPGSKGKAEDTSSEAETIGIALLQESQDMEDDDMLGGMFDALPSLADPSGGTVRANAASAIGDVHLREFGKATGMSPKRVLEEACRARDSRCRVAYWQVSPTTYASRHAVVIHWEKHQEILDASYLPFVEIDWRPDRLTVTMIKIATTDTAQSESYVATAALFVIFSSSPKEEKAHMKLQPAFRDLWDEFVILKREHMDEEDRKTVKHMRAMIEENTPVQDDDEDNDVVFSASIRDRSQNASGTATPNGTFRPGQGAISDVSQQLKDMWAWKISTPSYQRMLVARMNLPMYRFRDMALSALKRNQVTIICGETGCGKSTQLPAFILEHELSQGRPCKVYCTEPRRISAISLAQRVSEEMGERKGDVGTSRSLIGYAIRLESQTTAQTRLVYATVGIVLRMLESPRGLDDITHLVIDEIHERSIDTDFLLIVLRSLLIRRPDLKVVLMSATVDAQRFSAYLDNAPIVTVPGRTFPVQAKFLEDALELTRHTNDDASHDQAHAEDDHESEGHLTDTSEASKHLKGYSKRTITTLATYDEYRMDYSLIVKLLETVAYNQELRQFSKAILVFLPGIAEIRQLHDMLVGHQSFRNDWLVYPLHSSFSSEEQQAAFEIPPNGMRKIVLATNIAETGITIPDVTCVIDTGKHKEMRFDERRQLSRLIQSFIARANAKQRRGRAGRVQEGICFHLFTKYRHDELMAEQQTPEILRLSLQDVVMRVKICKLGNIEQALSAALDPPSSKNIRRAIDALIEVNALTAKEELTTLGLQLAKLPLDAQLGKLILFASIFGCLDFALTAAAMLSSKSPFLAPMNAKKQADTVRLGFKRGDSDLLTAYNAYCSWRKVCTTPRLSEYSFCNKNFLSPQNLANIEDLKAQLLSALVDAGFVRLGDEERTALSRIRHSPRQRNFVSVPASSNAANENDLLMNSVMAWSLYPKIIVRDGKGWRNIANNQSVNLHPTSVNKTAAPDLTKFLSFYSIMQSSSRFTNAQETSPVSDFALVLLAGDAVFNMYSGVIVVDGNRLRFKVRDWKTMIVLKTLRAKAKEIVARCLKSPGKELVGQQKQWMDILMALFEREGRSPIQSCNESSQ